MIDGTHPKAYRTAASLLPRLPRGCHRITGHGYDRGLFRKARVEHGISASTRGRKIPMLRDPVLYRQRYRIEIMFGRIKDWRRIIRHYDRSAHTFFGAITLAATVISCLN